METSEAYALISQAANEARTVIERHLFQAEAKQVEEHGGTSGLLYIGTMIGCALGMAECAAILKRDHGADEEEIGQWLSTCLSTFDDWRNQRLADPDGPSPVFEAMAGSRRLDAVSVQARQRDVVRSEPASLPAIHHPLHGLAVDLDVTLSHRQRAVPGKRLDVSKAAAELADVSCRHGYEGSSSGMAGAAFEPESEIPITKQVHDHLS